MNTHPDSSRVSQSPKPTDAEIKHVVDEAEQIAARAATTRDKAGDEDHGSREAGAKPEPKRKPRSRNRRSASDAADLIGGEVARRAIKNGADVKRLLTVARRVGSRQTQGMTDEQVLRWLIEKPGRLRTLAGHLHEHLDAEDFRQLAKLTGGRTPLLKLYDAHNRPGLDGAYTGARKAGKACFAQHKLSENQQLLKKAAEKTNPRLRARTELVVSRGTKVGKETVKGLKGTREAGRSAKEINKMIQKAADPSKVTKAGTQAAQKLTLKAGGGAAVLGAGLSVASDVRGLAKGEKTAGEVAENAAWAGGEAAVSAVAVAGATTVAAPSIAVGTMALAGSSMAGTTAMAAGLASLGPIGLGIGVGMGVGFGVKKLRKATRG